MIKPDANVFEGTLANKQQKHYHTAGVTNIDSSLVYDCSGFHRVTVDIIFAHNGTGFESIGNAYNDLINDIHELLKKSRGYEIEKEL